MGDNKFLIVEFNNEKYIYIDTYRVKGKDIYHFATLKENVFCYKKDDKFILIQDKFVIDMVRNKYHLVNSKYLYDFEKSNIGKLISNGVKLWNGTMGKMQNGIGEDGIGQEVDEALIAKVRNEQKENFRSIKEKYGLDIDLDEINERIDNIPIEVLKNSFFNMTLKGRYIPAYDKIQIKEDLLEDDSHVGASTRLHEFIHAMQRNLFENEGEFEQFRGLIEAETENLSTDYFGETIDPPLLSDGKGDYITSVGNDTSYAPQVILVKQMEYMLGKKSYESIIKGDLSFEKDFISKYGVLTTSYIETRTNRMINEQLAGENCSPDYDNIEYLDETQNFLLQSTFDRDQRDVETISDAKAYFDKLRGFKSYRLESVIGNAPTANNTPEDEFFNSRFGFLQNFGTEYTVQDEFYDKYYEEKYNEITSSLIDRGFDEQEVRQELMPFQNSNESDIERLQNARDNNDISYIENTFFNTEMGKYERNEEYSLSFVDSDNIDITLARHPEYSRYYYITSDKETGEEVIFAFGRSSIAIPRYTSKEEDIQDLETLGYSMSKVEIDKEEWKRNLEQFISEGRKLKQNDLDNSSKVGIQNSEKLGEEVSAQKEQTALVSQDDKGIKKIFKMFQNWFNNLFHRNEDREQSYGNTTNLVFTDSSQPRESKSMDEGIPSWDLRNYGMTKEEATYVPSQEEVDDLNNSSRRHKDNNMERE